MDGKLADKRGKGWLFSAPHDEKLRRGGIVEALRAQGLSQSEDTFLVPHGIEANAHIADEAYRRSDLMQI